MNTSSIELESLMTDLAVVCFNHDLTRKRLVELSTDQGREFLEAQGFTIDQIKAIYRELGRQLELEAASLAPGTHLHVVR